MHCLDQVQDSERKTEVQEFKEKDETLGEVNNNHAPHGEESMSVVKGSAHSGSGVL